MRKKTWRLNVTYWRYGLGRRQVYTADAYHVLNDGHGFFHSQIRVDERDRGLTVTGLVVTSLVKPL